MQHTACMNSKRVQAQGQSPPPFGPRPVAQERGREKAKERERVSEEWMFALSALSLSQRREECLRRRRSRGVKKRKGAREGEQKRAARAAKGQGKGASNPKPSKGWVEKKKMGSEKGKNEGE